MATVTAAYVTPEEYLARERQAETRSEYRRGEVFAIAGGTLRHARIITSLVQFLAGRLADRQCDVFSTDVRLAVASGMLYTYPDVMVVCGQSAALDDREDTITDPILLIEVLSDSTRDYDRGQKFQHYRALPSLLEYLTVAQDQPHVEQWTRQSSGQWLMTEFSDPAAVIAVSSVSLELPVSAIYAKLKFTAR